MGASKVRPCLLEAWQDFQQPLADWLLAQTRGSDLANDVLQEVFLRALRQNEKFCRIDNPRAWLFRVAKNCLHDHHRLHQRLECGEPHFEHLDSAPEVMAKVDGLAECLPRVLLELSDSDRHIIQCCDIDGMSQKLYAQQQGLSLSAAKSRLQRARQKLRQQLVSACQVRFDEQQQVCCYTPRQPV